MESSDEDLYNFNYNYTEEDLDENKSYLKIRKYFVISRVVLFTITAIVGMVGNGLVIWITGFKMKNVSAVWFLNLAVADFLSSLFLLLYIIEWAFPVFSMHGLILCTVRFFTLSLNMMTSVYFLMVISLDRCVSTMWPLWTRIHRRVKPARIISGIIWVFCLVSGFMYEAYHFFDRSIIECILKSHLLSMVELKQKYITRMIVMFVLPFTIIFFSYGFVAFKIRARRRWQKSRRPFRVIVALVLCFFVCWFPFHMSSLTPDVNRTYRDRWKNVLTEEICLFLAYLNSCLNPIIYVLVSHQVKTKTLQNRIESAVTGHIDLNDDEEISSTTHRTRGQCSSAL